MVGTYLHIFISNFLSERQVLSVLKEMMKLLKVFQISREINGVPEHSSALNLVFDS